MANPRPLKKARTEVLHAQERLEEVAKYNQEVGAAIGLFMTKRSDPPERELECLVCKKLHYLSLEQIGQLCKDAQFDPALEHLLDRDKFVCDECRPRCFICGQIFSSLYFLTSSEQPVVTCGEACAIGFASGPDRGDYLTEDTLRSRGKLVHDACKVHPRAEIKRSKPPVNCQTCLNVWTFYKNFSKGKVAQNEW